jgi:hypothetical protein
MGFYLLAFQGLLLVTQEGAVLPDRGKAVTDQQIAEDMLADLEEQRPDMEESR